MNDKIKMVEEPSVTFDVDNEGDRIIIIHTYINLKGKMVLNKLKAGLIILELFKFIKE